MTKKKDLKRRVRERAAKTGESYASARKRVLDAREPPAPSTTTPPPTPPSANEVPALLRHLPPEMLKQRQSLIVDLAFDILSIPPELRDGTLLGFKCAVVPSIELLRDGLARKALEGFKAALAALAGDPAAVLLRRLTSEGIGPPAPATSLGKASAVPQARFFPSDLWSFSREGFPFALAMLQRLEAGLVGLGPDGRSLAFFVDGHTFIATCATRGEETVIQLESKESWAMRISVLQRVFGTRRP